MIEFERKFLIKPELSASVLNQCSEVQRIEQAYFMEDAERCVRVRQLDGDFWLTLKSKTDKVGAALEVEFPLSAEHGLALMSQARSRVQKIRRVLALGEFTWEIDEFVAPNRGLVLAEVELADDAQSERLTACLPEWVAREVTGDPRYFNTYLSRHELNAGQTTS